MAEPRFQIESVRPVGRYALGVVWGDRHDSIFPFAGLRAGCSCDACRKSPPAESALEDDQRSLVSVQQFEGASVMLRWKDGHETMLLNEELREACRCARCAGEPDRPITGT